MVKSVSLKDLYIATDKQYVCDMRYVMWDMYMCIAFPYKYFVCWLRGWLEEFLYSWIPFICIRKCLSWTTEGFKNARNFWNAFAGHSFHSQYCVYFLNWRDSNQICQKCVKFSLYMLISLFLISFKWWSVVAPNFTLTFPSCPFLMRIFICNVSRLSHLIVFCAVFTVLM